MTVTDGPKTDTQHMRVDVYKVPVGYVGGDAHVSRGDKKKGATSNVMQITSADVEEPSASGAAQHAERRPPARRRQGPRRTPRPCGGDDLLRRASASRRHGDARRHGARQTVAAHEAGHMFGLDDEYTGAGAYGPGKKTEHTDFAAKEGFTGAMHATSDAIMSGGKEVGQHHYVTLIDALRKVSGMKEWAFGRRRPSRPPTRELGDYPEPDPNATDRRWLSPARSCSSAASSAARTCSRAASPRTARSGQLANVHAQLADGNWSFSREEEAAWERDGAVPDAALVALREAIAASGFFDVPDEVRPGDAVIHGADHLWTARVEGREHRVALRGVPEARSEATDRLAEALEDALDAANDR